MLTTKQWASLREQKQVLALMGPTASGKSRLSMALAEALPIEIISVDSALIYQDMDIGTAKPTPSEQAVVPHHLIDILSPTESYSAAQFVAESKRLVAEIFERGHLPVMVGGTMMYFNALQKGLSQLPEADETIRQKWLDKWQQDPASLHDYLKEIDPVAAARIHQNDPQRLVRAIEVFEISGQSLTALQQQGVQALSEFTLVKFGLIPENRAQLHQTIAQRFEQMLSAGLIDEVKQLQTKYLGLHPDLPSIRSVGYRQAWSFLGGEYDEPTFIEKGIVATRQLAKRQLTWLRKEPDLMRLDPYKLSVGKQVAAVLNTLKGIANP